MSQRHDRRAAKLFMAAFGSETDPRDLDRRHWDFYIDVRRTGELVVGGRRYPAVRARPIQQDLKLMVAVLNWACGVIENGQPLLERNPWGTEIRRSQSCRCRRNEPHADPG
jgi:hypothetical protein